MARDVSATIKINDGFSTPLQNFASRIGSATNKLGELGQKLGGFGRLKPPTPDFDRFNSALERTNGLFGKMVGANVVGNVISSGIGAATGAFSGLISELNSSSTAWQTFNQNMAMVGMNKSQIDSARADMQKFAQQTIYSSSDMATTYSQFAAVGVKDAGSLVKGFGGLAAAATDPQQAMKTLSQQSVQAAAKPTVQWQDFRLMLEQTPAGMAQVAKTMGTSVQDMIKNVQAGKVKTVDFFNAIKKTGTSAHFTKMATQYKTIGQAADGLKETLANSLQPAFDKVSKVGIDAVSSLVDAIGNVDFNKMADKVAPVAQSIMNSITALVKFVGGALSNFWSGITSSGAVSAVSDALGSISGAIGNLFGSLSKGGNNPFGVFKTLGDIAGGSIVGLAKTIGSIANAISKIDPNTLKLLGAAFVVLKMGMRGLVFTAVVAGLNALSKLNAGTLNALATALIAISIGLVAFKTAAKGVAAFNAVKDLFSAKKPATPQTPKTPTAPTAPETPKAPDAGLAKKWLQLGAVFVMVGAGAALLGAGLWLMASAASNLAQSGGAAIAVFFGFFVAIGLLLVLVRALGPALLVGAAGFVVFAAAMVLIGVAIFIAAAGITLLATQLPTIAQYGLQAAVGIVALGAAIAVFGALSIVGAVGLVLLGAGLVVAGAGLIVASVGGFIFGAALFFVAAGLAAVGGALVLVGAGLMVAAVGFQMLVTVVSNAINGVVNAVRNGFTTVVNTVRSGIQSAVNTVSSMAGEFLNAGMNLMRGLANGIGQGISWAVEKAKSAASSVAGAVKGFLGIHSPSRLFASYGNFIDLGLAKGIESGVKAPIKAAGNLSDSVLGAASDLNNGIDVGINNSLPNSIGMPELNTNSLDDLKGQTIDTSILNNLPQLQIAGLNNLPQIQVANNSLGAIQSPVNSRAEQVQSINNVANNGTMQYVGPQSLGVDSSSVSLPSIANPKLDTSGLNNMPSVQFDGVGQLPQFNNPKLDTNGFDNVLNANFGALPQLQAPTIDNPKLDTSGLNNMPSVQFDGVGQLPQFNNPKLDTNGFDNVLNANFGALPQLQAPKVNNPKLDASGLNNIPPVQFAGFGQLPQFNNPTLDTSNAVMPDVNANVNQDVPTSMPFDSQSLQTSNVYNNTSTNNQGGNKSIDQSINIAAGAIVVNGAEAPELTAERVLDLVDEGLIQRQNGGEGHGYK